MPPTTTYFAALTNRLSVAIKLLETLKERRIVSKPQNISRLRYVNIVHPRDETVEEKHYRIQNESLQEWNNKYWSRNNELFNDEKKKYIKKNYGLEATEEEALSHDQLAPFYQSFLERNRKKHVAYNTIWYKNHISLLASSMNAKLSRLKVNMNNRNKKTDQKDF